MPPPIDASQPTPAPTLGAAPLVDAGRSIWAERRDALLARRDARRGALFMVASALGFSVMSLLVKLVSAELPTMEIVFFRSLIMGAFTLALIWRYGAPVVGTRIGLLLARGIVGASAMALLYLALARLPLGDATTLHYTAPVWTALTAAFLLGERLRPLLLAGTAVCLVGVVLVAQPAFLFGTRADGLDLVGVGLALGSAVLSGLAYTFVRQLRTTDHPLTIVLYLGGAGMALSLPFAGSWVWPTLGAWAALLGIGVSTQVGQLCLTRGLHLLEAGTATAIGYLQIVFAFGWGLLVFGETPEALSFGGALLVLSSVLLIVRRGAVR